MPEQPTPAEQFDVLAVAERLERAAGARIVASAAEALGAALLGERVALLVDLPERAPASVLGPLEGRALPVVVWARSVACPGPGAFPPDVLVFSAGTLQEALDLGLAARLAAEATLLPAVVLVPPSGWTTPRWPQDLVALLGRADDLLEPPTPGQRSLFGLQRRRVPRWFDGSAPVVTGGSQRPAVAEAAGFARHLVFGVPALEQVRSAMARVASATGRELAPLRRGSSARPAVLTAGPLGVVADQADVGALRLRLLRPLPGSDIEDALESRKSVLVLQDGADQGPGTLCSLARAAAPRAELRVAWRPTGSQADPRRAARLRQAFESFVDGGAPQIRLGAPVSSRSRFPRRDAAVQELREAAPGLFGEPAPALDPGAGAGSAPPLPGLLRRVPAERHAPDSLPRFWGELLQPWRAGAEPVPTALLASGAVAAGATALQPARQAVATIPELIRERCTGCGACWAACPDSAFAATALPPMDLLNAVHSATGASGKAAGEVRRSCRTIARAITADPSRAQTRQAWREAWDAAESQSGGTDEERAARLLVWQAMERRLDLLKPFATEVLFERPERRKAGDGALLLLGLDPDACTGCGLCVASCGDAALRRVERSDATAAPARAQHAVHEGLPDTPGAVLARYESEPEGDPVRAVLLSRACAEAQLGGGDTEPGSGPRLAARLVAAFAEEHGARGLTSELLGLRAAADSLRARLQSLLSAPTTAASPQALLAALEGGGRLGAADLARRLEAAGATTAVDADAVALVAAAERDVTARIEQVESGVDGLGTARFGVVAAAPALAPMLSYPQHPWFAPAVVVPERDAVDTTRSLLRAWTEAHADGVRLLRRAELLARSGANLRRQLDELDALVWATLGPDDRRACPPLLLLLDAGAEPPGLAELLATDLPVRVVLIDPGVGVSPDPGARALAWGSAFVGVSSPAAPEQLGGTLRAAFAAPGPSVVQIHAPSPLALGIESDRTLAIARLAVETRVVRLLRYDPAPTALHERFDTSGNPDTTRPYSEWSAALPALASPEQQARVERNWADLQHLSAAPVAPPAPPPAAPVVASRAEVEAELAHRLARNLGRLAGRGG